VRLHGLSPCFLLFHIEIENLSYEEVITLKNILLSLLVALGIFGAIYAFTPKDASADEIPNDVGNGMRFHGENKMPPDDEEMPRGPRMGPKGHQGMLEEKAEFLGMDVDALREELKEKRFYEILQEHGYTAEDWQAVWQEKSREMWKEMGLSDEEIAEREQRRNEQRSFWCQGVE